MTGWVRIDRKSWDHGFFPKEPMSEREAWFWIIARAAWEDTKFRVGGTVIDVPRGSFVTTLRELQIQFQWASDKRVRGFLERLEHGRMVGRTKVGPGNAPRTQITICNYDKYQGDGRTGDAPGTHRGRARGRTKVTINKKQTPKPPEGASFDEFEIAASRIRAGEAFDASYLRGWKRDELLRRELVTEDDLRRYA